MRTRFLSRIDSTKLKHVDELNETYFDWLEHDYQNKKHSSLGMSPLDFFFKQAEDIRIPSNPQWLEEAFMIRRRKSLEDLLAKRRIKANISIKKSPSLKQPEPF